MSKLYYVDSTVVPGDSAHSVQIESNLAEMDKKFDLRLISFTTGDKIKFCKHFAFRRPKLFNKIMPYGVIYLIYIMKKNFKFDSKKDFLFTRSSLIGLFFSKRFKKTIVEVHDIPSIKDGILHYFLFKFWLEVLPLFFLKYKRKIKLAVISKGLKKDLIKRGYNKNRIFVLPDGVDINKFDINLNTNDVRVELNLPKNKKIVLYTGSFQSWKGYNVLLEASKRLDKNVILVMVGGKNVQVKILSKQYPNVIFKGYVNNNLIPKYLKAADVLVLPNSGKFKISASYTSPLKLFEYMASKKPIVASNLTSIREIVNNQTVFFIKPDDISSLIQGITKVLKDRHFSKTLGDNAYKSVQDYTWERRIELFRNELEK